MIDPRFEKSVGDKLDYGTPWETFHAIQKGLGIEFDLNVCASKENAKCNDYYSIDEGQDALELPWFGNCFMNPPYGPHVKQRA